MEIDLCESILANSKARFRSTTPMIRILPPCLLWEAAPTLQVAKAKELKPHPSIRAAAISTLDNKGTLLLISDFAGARGFSRLRWPGTTSMSRSLPPSRPRRSRSARGT